MKQYKIATYKEAGIDIETVEGNEIQINGINLFYHKRFNRYSISDLKTGYLISEAKRLKDAKSTAEYRCSSSDYEKRIKSAVSFLKRKGIKIPVNK